MGFRLQLKELDLLVPESFSDSSIVISALTGSNDMFRRITLLESYCLFVAAQEESMTRVKCIFANFIV